MRYGLDRRKIGSSWQLAQFVGTFAGQRDVTRATIISDRLEVQKNLGPMFQLFRARRGRKAAVAAIAPHVEASRYRLDGISDDVWLEPYMVGFVCTLITLIARRAARGSLNTDAMGLVQMEAWAEITGLEADIGQELCLLSSFQDQDFADGCRCASAFLAAGQPGQVTEAGEEQSALWSLYFERRIAAGPGTDRR